MAGTTIITYKKQHSVKIIRIGRDDEEGLAILYVVWQTFIVEKIHHFTTTALIF